ncbi:MAG: ferric iron reductase [Acidimicrobiia bacterium]|nr:ferric iron reductase [Acidimicrobiia bacterium]
MTGSLSEVVAQIQQWVAYLRCATEAPEGDGWIACSALIADPALLRAEIDATAAGRETDDPQVAASLYVQSYAFRVASIAVAAYALGLPVPSTAPEVTAIRITRSRPGEVAITEPHCRAIAVAPLVTELFEGHLEPFVASVRSGTRIGERLLWGNVAASVATVFRAVQSSTPGAGDAIVRERAGAFEYAAEPWLGGLGQYSTLAVEERLGWYWNRSNCCLWYRTANGSYCDDCSLHDPVELTARRRADLLGSTTT